MDEQSSLGPGRRAAPPLRDISPLLERITARLAARHGRAFSRETVEGYVEECSWLLSAKARVGTHLPVLVERFADQRLGALARGMGLSPKPVPEVLFVCTENAGRSQLAAALMRHRAEDGIRVLTAGSEPGTEIAPIGLQLLAEQGLDPHDEFPKPLTAEVVTAADVVVTLGCGDACPVRPGRRYLDWDLPDLSGLDIESARAVRDALATRIDVLVGELLPTEVPRA
ncbi:low molecular weight phosphatase family protein [Streptomyces sp. NL15-2K]|uniref:arsenate-mycothiol transferase ArsC n=1 Tax=Streptomyces sp. NL15-2K TaxID=376149 RepID=UPI000F5775C0|nr:MULTISPECIES: arsenate reductase ArsC [Actinomycetes]WKX11149.1 arsenate reductase ArsC [Kutzneria buriramensis]GCB52059.1 arsenate reductase [Streptomyces sp. NL15-2K]